MGLKDISESLRDLTEPVLLWFDCVRSPTATYKEILAVGEEKQRVKLMFQLWIVIFLISLIVQMPIFHQIGISWNQIDFHIPLFLNQLLLAVSLIWCFHIGLRIWKIPSVAVNTFCIYTTQVASYSPFIVMLTAPSSLRLLLALKMAKTQHLGFSGIVMSLMKSGQISQLDSFAVYSAVTVPCLMVFSFVLMGLFAREISKAYSADEARVADALAFSWVILVPLVSGLGMLLIYSVYYAFV